MEHTKVNSGLIKKMAKVNTNTWTVTSIEDIMSMVEKTDSERCCRPLRRSFIEANGQMTSQKGIYRPSWIHPMLLEKNIKIL